ncbi:hypothetical protein CQ054_10550 [Ochrobactrum sp. MYb29]|nr:hypothetical protein CQ054_10550 [Ochrobactrum sp. MYb29]
MPDLQNILREQYKTQARYQEAAKMMAEAVSDIADRLRNEAKARGDDDMEAFWGEGGNGRAALHALGGGILGGSTDVAGMIKGAFGGVIAGKISPVVDELVRGIINRTNLGGTDAGRSLANIVSGGIVAGLTSVVSGGNAAAYAGAEFRYNYLTHGQLAKAAQEQSDLKQQLQQCKESSTCSAAQFASISDRLVNSNAQYQRISDQNITSLVNACSQGVTSADCVAGRRDLEESLNSRGIQVAVTTPGGYVGSGGVIVNEKDALLAKVLNDVAAGKIAASHISSEYAKALSANRTEGALTAIALAGVVLGPEVYLYCMANPLACTGVVEAAGCAASGVCESGSALVLNAKSAETAAARLDNMAANAATNSKLRNQIMAEEIANHGFDKHVVLQGEFADLGIQSKKQYQDFIENILNNPAIEKRYASDGTAYYLDYSTRTVVIKGNRGGRYCLPP